MDGAKIFFNLQQYSKHKYMKKRITYLGFFIILFSLISSYSIAAQKVDSISPKKTVADLIPKKKDGKVGFINQSGKFLIVPEYSNVGFFAEDCNLLLSPNPKVRQYGSADFASVSVGNMDYRIDKKGKKVYTFKQADLAICSPEFKKQRYNAYVQNGFYGLIDNEKFDNPHDYRQFTIYPQYQYLYILEGDDILNPMIIASINNKFGVIDVHQNIIVPFIYGDIKRNFSWKLGGLFEVSENGVDYFFVDVNNRVY